MLWPRFVMLVCFSIGKLGMSTPGCVNEVTEMECGHSEIDELIKEVSGDSISRGLARQQKVSSGIVLALPTYPEPWALPADLVSTPAKTECETEPPLCGQPPPTGQPSHLVSCL